MTYDEAAELRHDAQPLAIVRLIIGLVQGIALYLLYRAFDGHSWPATNGAVFAPLLLVVVFIPLLLGQAVGNMRLPTLVVWALVATAVVAGLAWYDIWRDWPWEYSWRDGHQAADPRILPSFAMVLFTAIGLFIAHALVAGGDADRRFIATYPTHFDVAWKQGLQIALSVAFVGAFWLLLWLGSELFQLIKLDFLEKLIEHRWFSIPVTTLATAAALHVTDVRAGLVRGARTLALVLLSWLLPLMALFAVGFLGSLVFTGLEPLWSTRTAAALLLTAAGVLVILINATYQDGDSERHVAPIILKLAARASAVALVPIVALAAYAISLRVQQYGWSDDRVSSTAVTFVAGGYALGYTIAALLPGTWMQRMEQWNFAMALVVLGVMLALFSPLADPARIAVNSQIARLQSGAVDTAKFDFSYLRFHGERFGYDALAAMKQHAKDAKSRGIAGDLLKPHPYVNDTGDKSSEQIVATITVYPSGRVLPESLVKQRWSGGEDVPNCLVYRQSQCDAFLRDLDGDGRDEVIFYGTSEQVIAAEVIARGQDGLWIPIGSLRDLSCSNALEAMRSGNFAQVTTLPRWRNVVAGSAELHFTPTEEARRPACLPE